MSRTRILLTGASGMVGQNFLEHPAASEFDVLAPSRRELDLTNGLEACDYLRKHMPDLIIHAAGRVGGIQANMREPVQFLLDNLEMGRNVILAARQAGVKRLINLGSSCMYPRGHQTPLREDQVLSGELEPTNEGYALAKIVTARLCEYVSREDASFQYKTLIPCNLYGRFDKFDPDQSHLIPAIIYKVHAAKLAGHESVEIWGDGTARREFMYAGDLADALISAVRSFDTLPTTMNIGLGLDYTIDEFYRVVADVIGYRGTFVHNTDRPVGMARKLVSIDRQLHWGWRAKTDLQTGITKTYDFYRNEWSK
jgi:GDP-L-fucose synthase